MRFLKLLLNNKFTIQQILKVIFEVDYESWMVGGLFQRGTGAPHTIQ